MNEEDEAFDVIDKAQGWRKRQIEQQLGQPIYFKPRKEWVDLTEQEMKDIWYETKSIMGWYSFQEIANLIKEKVKEKNHG